jgi:hypothetical protein
MLVLVGVSIPCTPVVRVLSFFSPRAPEVFLREGYAGNFTPCWVLVVVQIISFLPSARGLEFPIFDSGMGTLLPSQNEELQSSRLPLSGEARVQLLDRRHGTLLQGGRGSPAVRHSGER